MFGYSASFKFSTLKEIVSIMIVIVDNLITDALCLHYNTYNYGLLFFSIQYVYKVTSQTSTLFPRNVHGDSRVTCTAVLKCIIIMRFSTAMHVTREFISSYYVLFLRSERKKFHQRSPGD